MKKIFTLVLTIAILAVGTTAVMAAELTDEEIAIRHAEITAAKAAWLDNLVADGIITQEEADEFLANMEERFADADCEYYGLGIGAANEDRPFLGANSNEDGLLQRGIDGVNKLFQRNTGGRGFNQNGGFGQASGYDGDCILE